MLGLPILSKVRGVLAVGVVRVVVDDELGVLMSYRLNITLRKLIQTPR